MSPCSQTETETEKLLFGSDDDNDDQVPVSSPDDSNFPAKVSER